MNNDKHSGRPGAEVLDLERIKELHDQIQKDQDSSHKSSDTEGPFENFAYGKLSTILANFFIKLGVSANSVTLLSLVFGIIGSVFFYPQNTLLNFVGILIEYFSVLLDCADGRVARLTHSSTQLGRFLDGLVDIINFLAVYIVLGLRMMKENIPFTNTAWAWGIWIVIVVSGYCHAEQARMADYFRSLHLHFYDQDNTAFFTNSRSIRKDLSEGKDLPLYRKLYLCLYYLYTKAQELLSPNTQKLLAAIEEVGFISPELSKSFIKKSRRYVQLTNLLTFNLRAYTLYALILLKQHVWFFPFNVFILSAIMFFMISRYERIASLVFNEHFGTSASRQ